MSRVLRGHSKSVNVLDTLTRLLAEAKRRAAESELTIMVASSSATPRVNAREETSRRFTGGGR